MGMGREYAHGTLVPARPDRRRQRAEPEAGHGRPRRRPVPDARSGERRRGDRARDGAAAGRHPDGPAPARCRRHRRGSRARGRGAHLPDPRRGDERPAARADRRLAVGGGVRGVDPEAVRRGRPARPGPGLRGARARLSRWGASTPVTRRQTRLAADGAAPRVDASDQRQSAVMLTEGGTVKTRLLLAITLVALAFAAYAGNALATPGTGFAGVTLAKATFGNISSHVNSKEPQFWNEVIQTRGASDL